jgi:hypothetical protein
MRKFKMGLVTLAASAALLAPVGIASATTQGNPKNHNDGQCNDAVINVASCFTINDNELTLVEAELQCTGVTVPIALLGVNQTETCSSGSQQGNLIKRIGVW